MDRPFGLKGDDILVPVLMIFKIYNCLLILEQIPSSPSLSGAEVDSEQMSLRHMIQYAQMLRSIRSHEDRKAGILCHFINIRHWKESTPQRDSQTKWYHIALSTHAYVELLKQPAWLCDPDRTSINDEAFGEFSNYLDAIEDRLVSSTGAVTSMDVFILFSIGVIIAATAQRRPDNAPKLAKVSNALTLVSSRYPSMISLRDIILELQQRVTTPQSEDRLRVLVANSDVVISNQLQLLIFDHSSNHGPFNQPVWQ
jgi:hypothetical protein